MLYCVKLTYWYNLPLSRRIFTTSTRPSSHATCSGVRPDVVARAVRSAPVIQSINIINIILHTINSSLIQYILCKSHSLWYMFYCVKLTYWYNLPLSRRIFTTLTWPEKHATCSGVRPCQVSRAVRSAPVIQSINIINIILHTINSSLIQYILCKSHSLWYMFYCVKLTYWYNLPLSRRNSTTSTWPLEHAACSGVRPSSLRAVRSAPVIQSTRHNQLY